MSGRVRFIIINAANYRPNIDLTSALASWNSSTFLKRVFKFRSWTGGCVQTWTSMYFRKHMNYSPRNVLRITKTLARVIRHWKVGNIRMLCSLNGEITYEKAGQCVIPRNKVHSSIDCVWSDPINNLHDLKWRDALSPKTHVILICSVDQYAENWGCYHKDTL